MLRLVADKYEFTLASTFYDDESNQMYPLLSLHVWYKLYYFMNRNVAQIYMSFYHIGISYYEGLSNLRTNIKQLRWQNNVYTVYTPMVYFRFGKEGLLNFNLQLNYKLNKPFWEWQVYIKGFFMLIFICYNIYI